MYSKVIIMIVFILRLSGYAQSQNTYFDRMYDFRKEGFVSVEGADGILQSPDGDGYYFASYSYYGNMSDALLVKIDEQGDTIFTLRKSDADLRYFTTALTNTHDGGYVVCSYVINNVTANRDYSLIKFNSSNEIEFAKTYGDTVNSEQAIHAIRTNDNGFLIMGQSVVPPSVSADMYVVKTDSAGNLEWEQYYGGSNFEGAYSAVQTPDTGYLILGWTQSFGNRQEDFYLIKTDKQGNQQWQKTYGNSGIDIGLSICALADSNYLLTGGAGNGNSSSGVIRKIDAQGNIIWSKTHKHENNIYNELWDIVELTDGSLVSTGGTDIGNNAGWLLKTDSAGNKLWSRMYNKNDDTDLFYDLIATADGGFLMCGQARNDSNGSQDAWLLKVDSLGCTYPNCVTGIDEAGSKMVLVDIYPNPASDILNIELQENKEYDLTVSDLQGKVVYASFLDYARSDKYTVDVSGFANGVYLLTLETEDERTTVKVVVQH